MLQAALGMLGRMLHCKPGTLGIAGTKDKRSVSAQHLTAWQVCIWSLEKRDSGTQHKQTRPHRSGLAGVRSCVFLPGQHVSPLLGEWGALRV